MSNIVPINPPRILKFDYDYDLVESLYKNSDLNFKSKSRISDFREFIKEIDGYNSKNVVIFEPKLLHSIDDLQILEHSDQWLYGKATSKNSPFPTRPKFDSRILN
jgi:hypothetical protein